MAAPPSESAQASLIIVDAVERFKRTVTAEHKREMEKTAVKDVVDAIVVIQQGLLQRRANRNLRKLEPFVQALGHYGGAIDVLSNGLSPYLPFIWAPVKLMLQIASDYLGAFDKLLEAYDSIAATLPRIKELGEAFKDSPALLSKLALYYADILEFHRRAYKFVTRKSWHFFFLTTWGSFDNRFRTILTSMARNSDSIHNEAIAIDLIQSKKWRDESFTQVSLQEEDRLSKQYDSVVAWLNTDRPSHEDHCERVLRDCLPGSCDWVKDHAKVKHWLDADSKSPLLWVHGKPGAGKTVISASLIEHLQGLEAGMTTVYYFCSHLQADTSSKILKSFVLQLINASPDMASVVYTNYVQNHREPSVKVLKLMLSGTADKPGLLSAVSPCRIIIDGVDECASQEQKPILQDLLQLVSASAPSKNCKLLVCSRDLPEISRILKIKAKAGGTVALSEEKDYVDQTIERLARSRLSDLVLERETWQLTDESVSELCELIVQKADGMTLWVKLVLDTISDVDTLRELYDAIMAMPRALSELYKRILATVCGEKDHSLAADRSVRTMRILGWLVHAKRPLKKHELLNAVALTVESSTLSRWDMPDDSAINRCQPLVELLPNGNICLIHFTAEEYLREHIMFDPLNRQPFNRSIAFSCSLALRNGLDLLDPGIPEEYRLLMVLDGSHAVLPYAVDFWLEHLLTDEAAGPISPQDPVGIALANLEQRHRNLWSKTKHGAEWTEGVSVSHAIARDPRLRALSSTPVIPLCSALMDFRAGRKKMDATDGREFEKLSIEADPTLFTSLSTTFNSCVTMLLEGSHAHSLPAAELARFVKRYSQCSHPCRFSPCTSLFVAFPSEALRTAHEKLHVGLLFCVRSSCSIGRLGFRSQRDLDAHNRKYHEEGRILVPPRVRKVVPPATYTDQLKFDSIQSPNDIKLGDRSNTIRTSLSFKKEKSKNPEHFMERIRGLRPGDGVIFNSDVDRVVDFEPLLTVSFQSIVACVDFSPDSSLIAIGCDSFAAIFDVGSGQILYRLELEIPYREPPEKYNHVRDVSFHPNPYKNILAVGAEDGLLRVWDYEKDTTRVGSGHADGIFGVSYAPNGEFIATASIDCTLRLWHEVVGYATTIFERLKCTNRESGLTGVTVTSNSEYAIASSLDRCCLIYSTNTGNLVSRLAHASDSCYGPATSLNGALLAVASLDNTVLLYNIQPLKNGGASGSIEIDEPMVLKLHEDFGLACIFSVDSRYVFSASKDSTVICWDVETGLHQAILVGHTNGVLELAAAQNQKYIVTVSYDQTAKVWGFTGRSSQSKMTRSLQDLLT